jgi:hypothetical protein
MAWLRLARSGDEAGEAAADGEVGVVDGEGVPVWFGERERAAGADYPVQFGQQSGVVGEMHEDAVGAGRSMLPASTGMAHVTVAYFHVVERGGEAVGFSDSGRVVVDAGDGAVGMAALASAATLVPAPLPTSRTAWGRAAGRARLKLTR